ncbi:MAG: glycosyltransferase [Aestuariibacter sp.]
MLKTSERKAVIPTLRWSIAMIEHLFGHVFYLLILVSFALLLPVDAFQHDSANFIFVIGVVASWRYLWAVQHYVRALIYLYFKFPYLRWKVQQGGDDLNPSHVFLIVTSFRVDAFITARVYRAIILDAIDCGVPTTIIASVVEHADTRLMKKIFHNLEPPAHITLKIVRIAGTGKRDGLAAAFRAVSSTPVDKKDAVVSVIDGDSIMNIGCTKSCFRFFKLNPNLGALTTNEECILEGDHPSIDIYRNWYSLRFAQRHEYMASISLSNRVMTLTGRMSMFRASIICEPEFIDRIECDYVDHWRLGRFRFLTGDDKSSWYHVIKNGWDMLYIPDEAAMVYTVEEPPRKNFLVGALVLMRRWFGNMLRTNARARKIPMHITGIYVWWVLRDQLLSIWTALFGLSLAILGTLKYGPGMTLLFIFWILFTRYTLTLFLSSLRNGKFSVSWPLLLYFNQAVGSIVKVYILHHLYRQSWTRQNTKLKDNKTAWSQLIRSYGSNMVMYSSILIFIVGMGFLADLFTANDVSNLLYLLGIY